MKEHDFAYKLFSGHGNNHISDDYNIPLRDPIFADVLALFKLKPVKVFQVGAIETFDFQWRLYSGWADIIFGEYIQKYGGVLTVVDISLNSLSHSMLAANSLGYQMSPMYGDAIDYIIPTYDIYYLDGSNDPQETLDQYKKIENSECVVIVDDWLIKGTRLREYLIKTGVEYKLHPVANTVAVIDKLNKE